MAKFPVLLQHTYALGIDSGEQIRASILSASTVVLVCRGADKILVPAPDKVSVSEVATAVESLPAERRALVQVIDKRGSTLKRVRSYLEPLANSASKWPEDAFISFSEAFLYRMALATKYKAGIAASDVQTLREFVPIIDVNTFKGEARFRLAELVQLIAAYEPVKTPIGVFTGPSLDHASDNRIREILESSEFRSLLTTSGLLGLAANPHIPLSRLWKQFREIVGQEKVKAVLGLASSAGELGGVGGVAKPVSKLVTAMGVRGAKEFAPPFVPLGSAQMGIYKVALSERFPNAQPPPGTIYATETSIGGKRGHAWLNVGDEEKLGREEDEGFARRLRDVEACRRVQQSLF